ncbi:MAG: thioredoxin family protein [Marinifilaceae bacterium]|jgi:alkyl hydroperoxide reductase subunit AhpF|nr:thioredoxin family protein [Marinifilaceae bacterium]
MEIKIIESICCGSKVPIKEIITKALDHCKINADIYVISDYKEIASLGIMTFPAILINGKIVFKGGTPTYKEVIEIINNEI